MKQNNKQQSKLEYCISLVKKLPEYESGRTVLIDEWRIIFFDSSKHKNVLLDLLRIDGRDMYGIGSKSDLLILTALIADLERHLGIKKSENRFEIQEYLIKILNTKADNLQKSNVIMSEIIDKLTAIEEKE